MAVSFIEGQYRAFPYSSALAQYLRVKLSAGVLAAAGATDSDIGVLWEATQSPSGILPTNATVRLSSMTGTVPLVASGAITAGVLVYPAASGKVSATPSGAPRWIALEAATANNDIIECLPLAGLGASNPATTTVPGTVLEAADVAALTDSTGGTPAATLAAITAGASYAQADMVAAKNAIASLNASISAILTAIKAAGQMA